MDWNLADAASRLSEVLSCAATEGPQTIRRQGESFVLLSTAEFEQLRGNRPSFKEWLLNGPTLDGVEVGRERSAMREAEL